MYPYKFDERVLTIDLVRLKDFFPDSELFGQMRQRLQMAIDTVCREPNKGKKLMGGLSDWRKLPWASSSVPNADPWPDMRLIYRFKNGEIKIFAVGKRCPGNPNDIYNIAQQRLLNQ